MYRLSVLLCLLFIAAALARNPKDRYGILYVDDIIGNSDTDRVQIEQMIVDDNSITLDIINEWFGTGIVAENITFKDGIATLADDFIVNPPTYFNGTLFVHGGVFADAGLFTRIQDIASFILEDDTGVATIRGPLKVLGGISAANGTFTVIKESGQTQLAELLFPVGGINVDDGQFTVDPETGDIFADADLLVRGNIYLGNESNDDQYVYRLLTNSLIGGNTFIAGQDGLSTGGNLVILPGQGSRADGKIIIGTELGDRINITRPFLNSLTNASATIFNAQSTSSGDGGRIVFQAGDSTVDGKGGDLVLAPGLNIDGEGNNGQILFGTINPGDSDFDLKIGRPLLNSGTGGDTFFVGQNTENGDAGLISIRGGQVAEDGSGKGGDLLLYPGLNTVTREQGKIFLGRAESGNLTITRFAVPSLGGDFRIVGQSSSVTNGGDLIVAAGSSLGHGNGGNLHLVPGSSPNLPAGNVIFGRDTDQITVTREPVDGAAQDTYLLGQEGKSNNGGDLYFYAGEGFISGSIDIEAGAGTTSQGGDVLVTGGEGYINGGSIYLRAGNSIGDDSSSVGGDIVIQAGEGIQGVGGDVYIYAGSGVENGQIIIGPNAETVVLDTPEVNIVDTFLFVQSNLDDPNYLEIKADPTAIISHNGKSLIRSISDIHVPTVSIDALVDPNDQDYARKLSEVQRTFRALLNALGQCQHGLFEILKPDGVTPNQCFTPDLYSGVPAFDAPPPSNSL